MLITSDPLHKVICFLLQAILRVCSYIA